MDGSLEDFVTGEEVLKRNGCLEGSAATEQATMGKTFLFVMHARLSLAFARSRLSPYTI
jgi:hypothetical protein